MNWNIAGFKRDKQGLMSNSPNAGIYYSEETFDLYSKAEEMANLLHEAEHIGFGTNDWRIKCYALLDSMRVEERISEVTLSTYKGNSIETAEVEAMKLVGAVNQLLKDVEALRGKS